MSIPFTLIRLSENDYLACLVISTRVWGDLGIVYQYRYPHPSAHLAALASHFNGEQSEWRRFYSPRSHPTSTESKASGDDSKNECDSL